MARYRDAGLGYGPPGAAFQSLDELELVMGVTPDIQARIAPYLSVWHDGEPDTRIAAQAVLQAIRQASGAAPPVTTGPPDERVVVITAAASQPDGASRFVRRATVRIGSRAHGGLFQILTWDIVPE